MHIDAHQHFWSFDEREYGWIVEGGLAALRRDFLPEHLEPLIAEHGIVGTVAVQARQTLGETEWLLGLAAETPWIRGVVGWVDLRAGGVTKEIDRLRALPGGERLVGIRHVIQDEPQGFMDDEAFRAGVRDVGRAGLTYDLLIYERQLPEAVRFCAALDDQKIVLDHVAKPRIKDGAIDGWKEGVGELGAMPHVSVKVSGMVTEADWDAWTVGGMQRYLDVVESAFEPARRLLGSDWPVCTLAASYGEVIDLARPLATDPGAAAAAYGIQAGV